MTKLLRILVCVILALSFVDCLEYTIKVLFKYKKFSPIDADLYLHIQMNGTLKKFQMNDGET